MHTGALGVDVGSIVVVVVLVVVVAGVVAVIVLFVGVVLIGGLASVFSTISPLQHSTKRQVVKVFLKIDFTKDFSIHNPCCSISHQILLSCFGIHPQATITAMKYLSTNIFIWKEEFYLTCFEIHKEKGKYLS